MFESSNRLKLIQGLFLAIALVAQRNIVKIILSKIFMKIIHSLTLLTLSAISSCVFALPHRVTAAEPSMTSSSQSSGKLTEENVAQAMKAIGEAEKKEDVDKLLTFLVPYGVSEVTVESQGNSITRSLEGVDAHRQMLEKTFKRVKNREILNERQTIRFTPDGELAIVTRATIEKLTTEDGKQFISAGTDTFRFAWVDNQPKVISTKSQGWLEERSTSAK
jgi:Arc/MetJ family transcription regulator